MTAAEGRWLHPDGTECTDPGGHKCTATWRPPDADPLAPVYAWLVDDLAFPFDLHTDEKPAWLDLRRPADALADEILARILPLPLDERRAVMDSLIAAVIADCERRAQAPLPPLLPAEPEPEPELSSEEAAARVLDEERWGPVCYGEDCDDDEARPHIHCPWGGHHRHVLDRATGKEITP